MKFVVTACSLVLCFAPSVFATPEFVRHQATQPAFGEPVGVTMREPDAPRDSEAVDLWCAIGYSFYYTDVAVYYTVDGSTPTGTRGTPSGSTQVLRSSSGGVTFVRNESSPGGQIDWWKGTLPSGTRQYGQQVRYVIGAWHSAGGPEVFANNTGCSDGTCDNPAGTPEVAAFTNKIAWPGAGAGNANPSAGYPPVSFWKEEAIIGNTYCAAQLDQNGTYYDFHFPTPGGVQGVGTRNEGYVDGQDTFPPLLPSGWRGQMHLNQAMPGIRVDGTTYWLSNQNALGYSGVTQSYISTSNTVLTSQTLTAGGNSISISQSDFSPLFSAGDNVQFPLDASNLPQRHILIKRMTLTNNTGAAKTVQVYFYMDPALNGGDGYDAMFWDAARGAMTAFDKTFRVVTGTGVGFSPPDEYNPTTFPGYEKNNALYLSAAMKVAGTPGAAGGTLATESWRDTSGDQFQGWIGQQVVLPPGTPVEVDIILAGAHQRPIPTADAIYNNQLVPALSWFASSSMGAVQAATDNYWTTWLNAGVTIDTPEARYDTMFARSLLATALHCDTVNGGVIAGFHNGAYPYVWPRDAVYAAITLARTGHLAEAANVYRWMREVCYRDFEPWGRLGFWKQKYSTDGYVIWGAPQIDETAAFPWGVYYQYLMTGDSAFLSLNYNAVRDSVLSMSQDSSDSRLYFDDSASLMYSNNVWEDSYDDFLYSNAAVYRGLDDARAIAIAVGNGADATDAANRRNAIKVGLDGRLAWDGENTDVSQLGVSYPFNVYAANDSRAAHLADRINGVATDRFGNTHPLVNFSGEHQGTINRYWNDNYWRGGPWFLSTMWYGLYYAQRQDFTVGTADIDNHKYRLDLCLDRLGPAGMGAEQIAYSDGPLQSLMYPGQSDFRLQTAWPNAWESMSTMADSMMAFVDFRPDAPTNTMIVNPKLPRAWNTMTFRNLTLVRTLANQTHKVDLTVTLDSGGRTRNEFTNKSGYALNMFTSLRTDPGQCISTVTVNGIPVAYSRDTSTGRVTLSFPLATGTNALTTVALEYGSCCGTSDFNGDGDFGTDADIEAFFACLGGNCCGTCFPGGSDFNQDGDFGTDADIESFFRVLGGAPC